MSADDDFFAVAPEETMTDAPILLGSPPEDDFAAPQDDYNTTDYNTTDYNTTDYNTSDYSAFAQPSASDEADYLGDVNENPEEHHNMEEPVVEEPSGPTPMEIWDQGWQETLRQRKDVEDTAKAEMVQEAALALEAFQKEREKKREAAMAKNREDEQAKLEAIEADLENDNSWQRACKMVDLQHDSSAKSKDVKRMRDVMILLKNDPAKATKLGPLDL